MTKGQKKQKQTPEVIAKLEHAFSIDSTVIEACFFADISETTYHRWCRENEQLRERFKTLKSKSVFKARQTICDNLDDVSTAKWYLERKRKDEFSLKQEIQQNEANGSEYLEALRQRVRNNRDSLLAGKNDHQNCYSFLTHKKDCNNNWNQSI